MFAAPFVDSWGFEHLFPTLAYRFVGVINLP